MFWLKDDVSGGGINNNKERALFFILFLLLLNSFLFPDIKFVSFFPLIFVDWWGGDHTETDLFVRPLLPPCLPQ
jgi:hypothetical protein